MYFFTSDRCLEDPWISSYPEESYQERYCGYEDDDDSFEIEDDERYHAYAGR